MLFSVLERICQTASDGPAPIIASARVAYDLVSRNLETRQRVRSKRGRDRHIRGIATARHQDPSDPWRVEAGIEDMPLAAQISLEPAGEIHRRIHRRDADVAQITSAIACRYVHAA